VIPNDKDSEHPPALVSDGQKYVTSLINALMSGPDWDTTAIFLAWDDWGGFYDHVPPPQIDQNGYGLRVPGLLISPYARQGYIHHQTLSFDAYLRLVEDLFVGGQRLDPETDGRPDPRPGVSEEAAQLGDLLEEFDFSQAPRPPMTLPLFQGEEPLEANPASSAGAPAQSPTDEEWVYVVQNGDTLGEIALRSSTTVEAIAQANCIQNPNLFFTGQRLLIPASDPGS
jgi:phospholipase C